MVANKDELFDVLKEPTRENFRFLLQNHLGEDDNLDFKKEWMDREKEVKHILAIANSGGGCIIFGVEQKEDGTFDIQGLDKMKDPADLRNEVKAFLPDSLKYQLKDFIYDSSEYQAMIGKKFQILIIEDSPVELPFVCQKEGKGLKDGDIYVRKGTESEKANNYDIDRMIQRKINELKTPRKKEMKLKTHLEQLEVLYNELTYLTSSGGISETLLKTFSAISLFKGKTVVNKKDCYPKEDYDAFIVRVLDKKKKRIEEELDLL